MCTITRHIATCSCASFYRKFPEVRSNTFLLLRLLIVYPQQDLSFCEPVFACNIAVLLPNDAHDVFTCNVGAQSCTANCTLTGPGLPSSTQINCDVDADWIQASPPCFFDLAPAKTSDQRRFVLFEQAPAVTWPFAYQLAGQYAYRGIPGQLATITSLDDNNLVQSLTEGREVWLAGAQSETLPGDDVFWMANPLFSARIFSFGNQSGLVSAPAAYTHFRPPPMVNMHGAISMLPDGTWFGHDARTFVAASFN